MLFLTDPEAINGCALKVAVCASFVSGKAPGSLQSNTHPFRRPGKSGKLARFDFAELDRLEPPPSLLDVFHQHLGMEQLCNGLLKRLVFQHGCKRERGLYFEPPSMISLDFGFGGQLLMLLAGLIREPIFLVSVMAILAGFPLSYWAFDSYRQSKREGGRDRSKSMVEALGLGMVVLLVGLAGILFTVSRLGWPS